MGAARRASKRARAGGLACAVEVFERTGRRGVLAAWWLVSWAVRLVAIACERGGIAVMRWFDDYAARAAVGTRRARSAARIAPACWRTTCPRSNTTKFGMPCTR